MDDFHKTELEAAISEQNYGIAGYHIDHEASTRHAALAYVDLLEQRQVQVKLSNRGYEVVEKESGNSSHIDSEPSVFETLDDLLVAVSPMYGDRRAEEIMSRLSKLEVPS